MQSKIAEDILVAEQIGQSRILIVDDQLSLLLSLQALLQTAAAAMFPASESRLKIRADGLRT